MTLSLAIIINVAAELALLGGLAFVMTRVRRLEPHAAALAASQPASPRPVSLP
jgi:hypothetical protein